MARQQQKNPVKQNEDDEAASSLSSSCSHASSSSSTTATETATNEERDEIKEVLLMSKRDTQRVRLWRSLVTLMLLATAVAVTLTTYRFLADEQQDNFYTAFEQFSRTVSVAAMEQQQDLRESLHGLATSIGAQAMTAKAQWPFFSIPLYELSAKNSIQQSRSEIACIFHLVEPQVLKAYNDWVAVHYKAMVEESHMLRYGNLNLLDKDTSIYKPFVHKGMPPDPVEGDTNSYAMWEFSPPARNYGIVNWNMANVPDYDNAIRAMTSLKNQTIVTRVRAYAVAIGTALTQEEHEEMHSKLADDSQTEHPHSIFFHPIHLDTRDYNSKIVAFIGVGVAWDASLLHLLPNGVVGIHAIIRNNCNQTYTYRLDGEDAFFLGEGDLHEHRYDAYEIVLDLALHDHADFKETPGHCLYSMHIFPSRSFEDSYDRHTPEIFASIVALVFGLVAIVFFVYDYCVQRRNQKLVVNAARSNAIVSNMFPNTIRDRLIGPNAPDHATNGSRGSLRKFGSSLKSFMVNGGDDVDHEAKKPLADLFLETTVLFADIAGFTAWSSVREPSQVFTLLETIYAAFDALAQKRRVLKVETVGDCYVAVTGLPDFRPDHAVIMARFAQEVVNRMSSLTRKLETTLGACLALVVGTTTSWS